LGLHGFSNQSIRQLHDCGVAIVQDGKILAAIDEERLSRVKKDGLFPHRAYSEALNVAGIEPECIDYVAFPDRRSIWQTLHTFRYALSAYLQTGILPRNYLKESLIRAVEFNRQPPSELSVKPVRFIEHHRCHAASAYYSSPWEEATVVTLDGMGDYCIGGCVAEAKGGKIKIRRRTNGFFSPGFFYMFVTEFLGFIAGMHEGKVTGLAAYGNPDTAHDSMKQIIQYKKGKFDFFSPAVFRAIESRSLLNFQKMWNSYCREDLAAAAQRRLEDIITDFVIDAVNLVKSSKLVVAGGLFANVKLNQKILELPQIENIYVHPNMGDGGLSIGAALDLYFNNGIDKKVDYNPRYLSSVYLGPSYSQANVEQLLQRKRVKYVIPCKLAQRIAEEVDAGSLVGLFQGRMEYGPRALGNRSILASPKDLRINQILNERLGRNEFMPFAPVIIKEHCHEWFPGWKPEHFAARFMTITYDVNPSKIEIAPAIVHQDGTARPQVLYQEDNPFLYSVISEFNKISGLPLLINTSFNLHEEPIVCKPEQGLKALMNGALDVLAIEGCWVRPDP